MNSDCDAATNTDSFPFKKGHSISSPNVGARALQQDLLTQTSTSPCFNLSTLGNLCSEAIGMKLPSLKSVADCAGRMAVWLFSRCARHVLTHFSQQFVHALSPHDAAVSLPVRADHADILHLHVIDIPAVTAQA